MKQLSDFSSVRDYLAFLLERCSDEKVQMGGEAERLAREAVDLARRDVGGLKAWYELAAYRLAHLQMRHTHTAEELEEVDGLFRVAAGTEREPGYGQPLASIYRLAVLSRRMQLASTGAERGRLERERASTAEWVKQQLRRLMNETKSQSLPVEAELNVPEFNLLELATYFIGGEYRLAGLCPSRPRRGTWRVFSSHPAWGRNRLHVTQAFAEHEVRSLQTPAPSLVMCWDVEQKSFKSWISPSGQQIALHEHAAETIAVILQTPGIRRPQVRSRAIPDDDDDVFRQVLKRLRKKCVHLMGTQLIDFGDDDVAQLNGQVFAALPSGLRFV